LRIAQNVSSILFGKIIKELSCTNRVSQILQEAVMACTLGVAAEKSFKDYGNIFRIMMLK
jgi:S-adenosylmethionine/arginine decarboxylase-like enzyme